MLVLDGGIGMRSEVRDGVYTGRPDGPFTYREGKAEAIRELAAREGIDLARVVRLLGLGVGPADAARGRPPGGVNPTRRWRGWRAPRAGGSCASTGSRPAAEDRGGACSAVALVGGGGGYAAARLRPERGLRRRLPG